MSVLVMDCTTMGWDDPTGTPPTMAVTVFLRAIVVNGFLRVLNLKANSVA